MGRTVRIVGEPDPFEVLCETPTTMVLINPTARLRQQVSELEDRLATIKRQLAYAQQTDISGLSMDNP